MFNNTMTLMQSFNNNPILGNWVLRTTPASSLNKKFKSIASAYDSRNVVAISTEDSGAGGIIYSSDGGETWGYTTDTTGNQVKFNCLGYGEGKFVKGGVSSILPDSFRYSTNGGSSWNTGGVGGSIGADFIIYDGTKFVSITGVGEAFPYSAESYDGIVFNTKGQVFPGGKVTSGLAYGNGVYVAISNDSASTQNISYSNNLTTWTQVTHNFGITMDNIVFGNGIFIINSNTGHILTSSDGINWTDYYNIIDPLVSSIAYGNGVFVAGSSSFNGSGALTYYSYDGINWDFLGTTGTGFRGIGQICYVGNGTDNRFIAVCNTGGASVPSVIATLDFM